MWDGPARLRALGEQGRPEVLRGALHFLPGAVMGARRSKYVEANIARFREGTGISPFPLQRTSSATRSARFIYKINAVYLGGHDSFGVNTDLLGGGGQGI
ncbi:hypothetical protein GCM10008959_31730 [Deinococcus seoulensis]|uniref:Uncharacterized protein n=1 Tax=Deinococcus seoulensis TaxID=1837379 RepID=A0ABQ2RYR6_9DEIO|nr:hypothetical protein GCM10008959_31730 [Deinococcus seoulensis]